MSAPAVTVKDIWRGVLPEGTELLGGGEGLERRVEWACALRTRPPAFDAVKGGEMAFVPVRSIRVLDERLDLPQVMSSFAEKGGVAVAVLGEVSASSIQVADRLVMPLLRLPDAVHITDAHQACVRFILDQRALLHERAAELQQSLMELAMGGAGARAIIDRLADITELAAVWHDESGAVRYVSGGDVERITEALGGEASALQRWGDTITVLAADPPVREFDLDASDGSLASPIPARRGVGGFVSVIGPGSRLTQVARLAVGRAASACAIELDRERAVIETRDRLEGEFIESLLGGTYSSEAAVTERARRLGVDLDQQFTVIALRGKKTVDLSWEEDALRAARNVITHREASGLVASHEGAVCAVLTVDDATGDAAVSRLAEAVRSQCALVSGDRGVSAGVGRANRGATGVRGSYREAEHALAMGRRLLGPGQSVSFADLGLHRLLFAVAQHPEVSDFYRDVVGELVAYDERSGADLMTTLEAYFASNGSPTETAQRLHLHRNTVLYRLRRIEEIGKLRLDDPLARLNLHLCLRIRDVLQGGQREPFGLRAQVRPHQIRAG